jgi:tRNA(Arg) A34 adenosine deaminase TadA
MYPKIENPTNNQEFMREATEAARLGVANGDGGPFGSVVVKDGKVVGKSGNKVFATSDPTAHAEVMAIRDAAKNLGTPDLEGCEIYSLGEPCPMCMAAIYWARIGKVYYANTKEHAAQIGFDDSMIYRELAKGIKERELPMDHMPIAEAIELFEAWANSDNKEGLPQT